MEHFDYTREAHVKTAENIEIMLGRVGLSGESSEEYLKYCFEETPQLSEQALEASRVLRLMHVKSLGNSRGQPEYQPLEQIMLGLVFGRTPIDPPLTLKRAVECYAASDYDSELIKRDCLRAFICGVETMRARV